MQREDSQQMEPMRLGSRQNVILQLLIWLAITALLTHAFLQRGFMGFFWIAVIAVWGLITFIISPFTFGEVQEEGLRY
jgi:hypothetical protein